MVKIIKGTKNARRFLSRLKIRERFSLFFHRPEKILLHRPVMDAGIDQRRFELLVAQNRLNRRDRAARVQ